MEEERQDDNLEQDSSTVQDEDVDSSTTEETQDGEATSQQATEEPPFHEHPRFKELITDKNELKEENKRLQQQMYDLINKSGQSNQKAIEEKLYEANTPEEKAFWQQVEKISESKVRKEREEAEKTYQQELSKRDKWLGNIIAKDFLKSHPEVKKGSDDMKEITKKAQVYALSGMGLEDALEDAYTVVMSPKIAQRAAERERQKQTKTKKDKLSANVEQKTVKNFSGSSDKTLDQIFDDTAKELGVNF